MGLTMTGEALVWWGFVFVVLFGACVGSFLNVVILRMPEGISVIHPPSRDATGAKLAWWENIPVLSWVLLRGRSRYSGERISAQYPLIEAFTAVVFGGFYAVCYLVEWREPFFAAGLLGSWSVLGVTLILLACLIAATVIDARHFIIPLGIPWTATVVAVVVLPLAALLGVPPAGLLEAGAIPDGMQPFVPVGERGALGAATGGVIGLVIAVGLLWAGKLPVSFADEQELADPSDPDEFLAYPHPRREMVKEFLFLGFPLVGTVLGLAIAGAMHQDGLTPLPVGLRVLSGVVCGYLVGCGLVWVTRILGTLGFGKEAMGLGDVHLLGAIGAVVGVYDVVVVFFVAPFFGIVGAVVLAVWSAVLSGRGGAEGGGDGGGGVRAIPYGPYLAAAAVLVVFVGRSRVDVFDILP
ncbi:MAG: prepilin peptidase [Planctomycetota bacterium]